MPTPPSHPPSGSRPADNHPADNHPADNPADNHPAENQVGDNRPRESGRGTCRRVGERPLPDPASVRLVTVPDSAPPYDDALTGLPPDDLAARDRLVRAGEANPGLRKTAAGDAAAADSEPESTQGWPSRFAQVLVETLAGSRPQHQMVPWTTERARSNIQRLGPTLSAGQPTARQRPLVRRVVTSRPNRDVLEMTVIVGFGPRIRALAVRLERSAPRDATPGHAARTARWLCTDIEAA